MNEQTTIPGSLFLSHSHADKAFVDRLAERLRASQVRTWVDEVETLVGDSLIEKIERGIAAMEYLGVVLSPDSVESEWVQRELKLALTLEISHKRLKVLPILYRDCEIPGFLKDKKYADFRGCDTDPSVFEGSVERLLSRLLPNQVKTQNEAELFLEQPVREWKLSGRGVTRIGLTFAVVIAIGLVTLRAMYPQLFVQQPSSNNAKAQTFALQNTLSVHDGTVWSIAFSPDGSRAASGSQDRSIALWNTSTWIPTSLTGHQGPVYMVTFSSDGKLLASASADKTVKLWDGRTGKLINTLPVAKPVFLVAFSPDNSAGYSLVGASGNEPIRGGEDLTVWHERTGWRSKQLFNSSDNHILAIAFSPDGNTLAAAGYGNSIQLWNGKTEEQRGSLHVDQRDEDFVSRLAFSKNGNYLVAGDRNGVIKLWQNWEGPQGVPRTHFDGVTAVAFSPDNTTFITASHDKTVRLWNVMTKDFESIESSDSTVQALAFSPDGQTLLIGGEDKKIQRWQLRSNR